uniref:C2 domain containing protein, putative n=1 Tax=Theileria annulata TaxID=5874 RepID=A0A3B0NHS6_THEAN
MPRYSVGFTIHEAVFSGINSRKPIDPLVVVRCFDREFVTSVKPSKTVVACWDESNQWNNIELSQKYWNSGVIEFELQSANPFWRNDTLGSTALQLKLISTFRNNTFSGVIPLTAPNSVRIIGYLRISVNAYDLSHEALNNAQPSLTKEVDVQKVNTLEIPPLTSPLVYRSAVSTEVPKIYKYFHLYINVYTLEDVETELFGFSPHITCEYAGCRLQSSKPIRVKGISNKMRSDPEIPSTEDKTSLDIISEKITDYMSARTSLLAYNTEVRRSNYTFNQCFLMPVSVAIGEPTLEDNVILRVWKGFSLELPTINKTYGSVTGGISNKLLAEGNFSLSKLRSERQRPRWFNFYKSTDSSLITTDTNTDTVDVNSANGIRKTNCRGGINEYYAGRILIGASVKRINKASDVLKAHVASSHQLEPLSPSPTRIFCDVFAVESSNNFTFSEPFEVCLEVSCGPYKSTTDWQTILYRKDVSAVLNRDLQFLGYNDGHDGQISLNHTVDRITGWVCNFDSVQGRLHPMELLVSYNTEEQWYIFVRVLARRKDDKKSVSILGSSKFTFDDLPSYKPNTVKVPVWISLFTPSNNSSNIINDTLNLLNELNGPKSFSRTSSISTADTDSSGDFGNVNTGISKNSCFLNVLLSLEKEMFYSSTFNSSTNKQFRVASHTRRTSMVLMDYELRCYVYSAKMDKIYDNITVSVTCEGRKKTTSPRKNRSLFPVFMECLTISTSNLTPVNNIVPNVPILITLNTKHREERYSYSDTTSKTINDGDKLRLVKRREKIDVEEVLYSAVTTYNRLISSSSGHDQTGGVPRWLQIGNCELLLFIDMVTKSEAKSVPKFQMLPNVQDINVQLGLIGLRNLKLPRNISNDIFNPPNSVKNVVIKASVQNYGICTDDEQFYEIMCTSEHSTVWVNDGERNYDIFAVHTLEFKSPIGLIFDPFLELKLINDDTGDILGHCCFPLYKNNKVMEKYSYIKDLRHYLVPRRMFEVFDNLQKSGNRGSYELFDSVKNSSGQVDNALAEVFQQFQTTKEFKKMVDSLKFDNTSVSVPPKFLLTVDGKKVMNSSSLPYNLFSDSNIEEVLIDIPYKMQPLFTKDSGGNKLWSNNSHELLHQVGTNDENEMGTLKYFLTVSDSSGYSYCSYDDRYKDIAIESSKMFRMFRTSLKSSLFKMRLCLLSSSSFPSTQDGSNSYLAVEIASRQSRELLGVSDGLVNNINKSYEREIFLPEHSIINFKVIESYNNLTGDSIEKSIARGYIDVENRWFSKSWQKMQRDDTVPIERILLYENGHVQGHVNVLLQLDKIDKFHLLKTINLNVTQTSTVEIRTVIWSIRDAKIPFTETKKEMLDLFVCSRLDCHTYSGTYSTEQKTDIHYNCDSGNASFNWRVVYPEVKTPLGACHLQLSVYDFWKIGSPVFIGDVNLELKSYINTVSTTGNKVKVSGELPLYPNAKSTPTGFIQVTLQVLTQSEANTNNVGLGREEPNRDPYLMQPNAGRQWKDWLAHTGLSIDFSGYSLYVLSNTIVILFIINFFGRFIFSID